MVEYFHSNTAKEAMAMKEQEENQSVHQKRITEISSNVEFTSYFGKCWSFSLK